MDNTGDNIVDRLLARALLSPHKAAFTSIRNEEDPPRTISCEELALRVKTLGVQLINRQLTNKRALLIYQDTTAFIVAFLACQYAGGIPVPVPYVKGSRQQVRLSNIMEDAQVAAVLCCSDAITHLQEGLITDAGISIIPTDEVSGPEKDAPPRYHETAFIQYTSGSTGKPKGVVITHQNLMDNQELIRRAFGCNEHSIIFSWLPFHHDMGLIGNILHSIYAGCTCILMSPFHFMQTPLKWLQAISFYKVTHSGGPNFAYDLCVDKITADEIKKLNLSAWKVAYNGSEPVQHNTIQRFSDHFKPAGFSPEKFYPCYGLAEATLMVAGAKGPRPPLTLYIDKSTTPDNGKIIPADAGNAAARPLVSAGEIVNGMALKIIGEEGRECAELEDGEICIAGASITDGYWNKDNSELFHDIDGKRFLKTGDKGFLYKQELFVHGRIKEMLIVRGQNIYPYDIEQAVTAAAIVPNGVVLFPITATDDAFVIVAEIKRTFIGTLNAPAIINMIDTIVSGTFGIGLYDIVLTVPLGIPRTTSGKLQRVKCREAYEQQQLKIIASRNTSSKNESSKERKAVLLAAVIQEQSYDSIKAYLTDIIASGTSIQPEAFADDNIALAGMGIDSLRSVEIVNVINKELNIHMDPAKVFQENTLLALINTIEQMLWLNNKQIFGEEITI